MKTTVEIPDALLARLRQRAVREKTTLRALIHAALQQFLAGPRRATRFRLKDGSVAGEGLAQGLDDGDWRPIRELTYAGRGGVTDRGGREAQAGALPPDPCTDLEPP
ncbi:MAG: hypothetical protein CHACPFDD_02595 [Phycisphaerae bacterium]|nr:hypothetical protein [Phycisphaerae bacterium]